MKQIAAHSGLSVQTVSQILNDKGAAYRPDTRERVSRAAEELGYRSNSSAKAMRSGQFGSLVLLASTSGERSILPVRLLEGIHDEAAAHNLHLIYSRLSDEQLTSEQVTPKILRELMADGLLVNYNANIPPRMVALLEGQMLPAVWLNTRQASDCVYPDDLLAGRQATEYLFAQGHRRIGFVNWNGAGHYSATDRHNGYLHAMRAAGLAPWVSIEGPDVSLEGAIALVNRMCREARLTAVYTYAGETARHLCDAAALSGIRIPEQISLLTTDDHTQTMLGRRLDTMCLPEREMGRAAVQMLLQKIADRSLKLPPCVLPCHLERGNSVVSLIKSVPASVS